MSISNMKSFVHKLILFTGNSPPFRRAVCSQQRLLEAHKHTIICSLIWVLIIVLHWKVFILHVISSFNYVGTALGMPTFLSLFTIKIKSFNEKNIYLLNRSAHAYPT